MGTRQKVGLYLDNVSTTRCLPEVSESMIPYLDETFGNPSSIHDWGDKAREAVEAARAQVAQLVGANTEEIIFFGKKCLKGIEIDKEAECKWTKKDALIENIIEHKNYPIPLFNMFF